MTGVSRDVFDLHKCGHCGLYHIDVDTQCIAKKHLLIGVEDAIQRDDEMPEFPVKESAMVAKKPVGLLARVGRIVCALGRRDAGLGAWRNE